MTFWEYVGWFLAVLIALTVPARRTVQERSQERHRAFIEQTQRQIDTAKAEAVRRSKERRERERGQAHLTETWYVLASTYGHLGEQAIADDMRAFGDLFKLLDELDRGVASDRDLAVVEPDGVTTRERSLGECQSCGVTIYRQNRHRLKKDGTWWCPSCDIARTRPLKPSQKALSAPQAVAIPELAVPCPECGALGTRATFGDWETLTPPPGHTRLKDGSWRCPVEPVKVLANRIQGMDEQALIMFSEQLAKTLGVPPALIKIEKVEP